MADLSALIPIFVSAMMVFLMILAMAALYKAFYKKVNPGEVIILNTLASEPTIVRTGTFIFPIIYSFSKLSLNIIPVEVQSDIIKLINDKYGVSYSKMNVQLIDKKDCILNAHKRINSSNLVEQNKQLSAIVQELLADALNFTDNYADFKTTVNPKLSTVGYEMINQ